MLVNLTTMHVNLTIPDNNCCVRPGQRHSDYHVNGQSVNLIAMLKFPLPVSVILSSSAVTFTLVEMCYKNTYLAYLLEVTGWVLDVSIDFV